MTNQPKLQVGAEIAQEVVTITIRKNIVALTASIPPKVARAIAQLIIDSAKAIEDTYEPQRQEDHGQSEV